MIASSDVSWHGLYTIPTLDLAKISKTKARVIVFPTPCILCNFSKTMSTEVLEEGGALSAQLLVHKESTFHGNQKQQKQLLFGSSKCNPLCLFGALFVLLAAVSFGALALSVFALQNSAKAANSAKRDGSKEILSQVSEARLGCSYYCQVNIGILGAD